METKILKSNQIQEAADLIRDGKLVSFPTETVYGLGADATNATAVEKVYKAKGRPSDNPLIVHVADVETVEKYVDHLDEKTKKLMNSFWPGPLTIILKIKDGVLPKVVTGGLQTAAFRNPNQPVTTKMIEKAGVPIVGPSANTSGKPSPTTALHVYHDLNKKIDGILDDGQTKYGIESTVLDMSVDEPVILRPGAVTEKDIEKVIGKISNSNVHLSAADVPKAPGMKYRHYAPEAKVQIVKSNWSDVISWINQQNEMIGIMATDDVIEKYDWPKNTTIFSLGKSVTSASHFLFDGLRNFDDHKLANILVQSFSDEGMGAAYMNRLLKSAGNEYFS
ncbi:threonylcarbamoyl-AMP synthase [Lactobacillus sp. S2-2]|uniref:L-threonylcarbamoyladenylate synthase n=1 Tax=Lactobacillus sp. S2-2 TaxID=2692917 RepID=UPI001F009E46|nr:L-threonylcarbamoyladenylate synthase [Lactobacillus sp. S2-2]MCF6515761.1 threonylcarbamoyl-AMP synthase [Lactobacillus sp. S2-2]